MHLLSAVGPEALVRAAADELDRHDPSPADAVSWFEEEPQRFRLEVYAPTKQDAHSARAILGAAAPELHVTIKRLKAADWVALALDGLGPVRAGRFVVAGRHALGREHGGRKKLWIEASQAFGTGHHGTTWGCLMALEYYLRKRSVLNFSVLDVGAGSGVLSIAAAKAGAQALAIEIDPRAAAIAETNAKQNAVAHRVRVIAGDGARHIAGQRFDLVFANILMRPLIRLSPLLVAAMKPNATLILSGLLRSQIPLVRQAYQTRGLALVRTIKREAWATLVFRKRLSGRIH